MTDELWEWGRSLSAERQRRVSPERRSVRSSHDDLRDLVKVLAGWLNNPGPTDAERAARTNPNGATLTMPLFGTQVPPTVHALAEPVLCRHCGRPLAGETCPWEPIPGQTSLFDIDESGDLK